MAIPVSCPNASCGKVYNLKDELAGKKVRCNACGGVIEVPAAPAPQQEEEGGELELQLEGQDAKPIQHHPARLTCTNCGAVLGVRDAICPGCGGDVRSGVTIMRITKEEKARWGLFSTRPGGLPLGAILGVVIVLVAAAIAVYVVLSGGKGRPAPAPPPAEEQTAAEAPAAP